MRSSVTAMGNLVVLTAILAILLLAVLVALLVVNSLIAARKRPAAGIARTACPRCLVKGALLERRWVDLGYTPYICKNCGTRWVKLPPYGRLDDASDSSNDWMFEARERRRGDRGGRQD